MSLEQRQAKRQATIDTLRDTLLQVGGQVSREDFAVLLDTCQNRMLCNVADALCPSSKHPHTCHYRAMHTIMVEAGFKAYNVLTYDQQRDLAIDYLVAVRDNGFDGDDAKACWLGIIDGNHVGPEDSSRIRSLVAGLTGYDLRAVVGGR